MRYALGMVPVIFYLLFRSGGWDDFDSFSFALALDNFDLYLQQPQAPGFPVYIWLGQMFRFLLGDAQIALTVMSAISGSISVWLVAEIGRALNAPLTGYLAALILAVSPAVALHSGIALSDMTGIAFMLGAIWLFLLALKDTRYFILACFITGLALGVRPQSALPIALPALWMLGKFVHQRQWKTILIGFFIGGIAIIVWLAPLLIQTGGISPYLEILQNHAEHVSRADSMFGRGEPLTQRWHAFYAGWVWLFGGDDSVVVLCTLILGIGVLLALWHGRKSPYLVALCVLWFGMSVLRLFFYESLERPRLFVPSLFPLVILAAHGWVQHGTQFPRWRIATRIPPVVIIIILLLQTLMLAPMLRTIRSAPEQAIAWASDAYSPEETLVIAQGSFRAVQMLMADYPMLYTQQFDATDWNQVIHDRAPRYLVVLDRDDVSSTVMQTFNTDYTPLADRTFERDRRIFPQHVTVRVQVFTPLNQLDADALLLDDGGQIHAGQVEHGRYFGEGWFRAEDIGGTMARWAGETATVRITLEETAYQLTFYATPFTANQAVEVWVNDEYVATRLLDGIWAEHQVIIPAEVIQAGVINTITLNHAHAESSPDDSRELSAAYSTFQFQAID